MIDLILTALSAILIVEMTLRKIWKKSISTFILIIGFSFYFCCKSYGFYNIGGSILAVLMIFAYYRALFKKEGDTIKTWGLKNDKQQRHKSTISRSCKKSTRTYRVV